MIQNDEDIKYNDVVMTLHSLQKVNSPANFEADLMRRINSGRFETKKSIWDKLLLPSRLIPSAALAISVILVLFFFNPNSENYENPLTSDPRVREDFIVTDGVTLNRPEQKTSDSITPKSNVYAASASNSELFINKSGLNFRQIRLTDNERAKLNELKAKIKKIWRNSGSEQ